MLNNKSGQSTIEYVLLVTAVVAVMIVFTTGSNTTGLKGKVLNTYNGVGENMGTKMTTLTVAQDTAMGAVPLPGVAGFNVTTDMPNAVVK